MQSELNSPNNICQGSKKNQWGMDSLSSKCWVNRISRSIRKKFDPYFTPLRKTNSKWINDLNIRPATIKALEEK